MHIVAVAVDQAGVRQMWKLCDLFFKNWIKKTSFQNEYYGQTFVWQFFLMKKILEHRDIPATTHSVRVERQLAVIGNAVGHTVGHGQGQWMVSGQTTDTPSLKISIPLALPIWWQMERKPGKAQQSSIVLAILKPMMLLI